MITLPNLLSLLRIPLAFAFLSSNISLRLSALFIAMLTDFLDGYLARRFKMCSRIGTTLDPMTDKFFVMFALFILFQEHRLSTFQAISLLCRDFSVMAFGAFLLITRQWDHYQFRSIWCGKLTTALQLCTLSLLTMEIPLPNLFFYTFIFLGTLALAELYMYSRDQVSD